MAGNEQVIVDLARHAFDNDIKPAARRHATTLQSVSSEGGDIVVFMSLLAGHTMALALGAGVSLAKDGSRPVVLGIVKGLLLEQLERQLSVALTYDGPTLSDVHAG